MQGHDTIYCDGTLQPAWLNLAHLNYPSMCLDLHPSISRLEMCWIYPVMLSVATLSQMSPSPGLGSRGGGEVWKRVSNSVTVTVTEVDDGEKITCTAKNMVGTAHNSAVLHIISKCTGVTLFIL